MQQTQLVPLRYHNAHYGFTFYLPASWKGCSITPSRWQTDANLVDNAAHRGDRNNHHNPSPSVEWVRRRNVENAFVELVVDYAVPTRERRTRMLGRFPFARANNSQSA